MRFLFTCASDACAPKNKNRHSGFWIRTGIKGCLSAFSLGVAFNMLNMGVTGPDALLVQGRRPKRGKAAAVVFRSANIVGFLMIESDLFDAFSCLVVWQICEKHGRLVAGELRRANGFSHRLIALPFLTWHECSRFSESYRVIVESCSTSSTSYCIVWTSSRENTTSLV